jgi:hypothetical protein
MNMRRLWIGLAVMGILVVLGSMAGAAAPGGMVEQRPTRAAPQGSLQQTITAAAGLVGAGAQATLSAIPQISTTLQSGVIQQTMTAAVGSISADMQATLRAMTLPTAIILNQGSASVTASMAITEAQINTLVNTALASVGYGGAVVDLVPAGAVITIPNVTLNAQYSGTLVLTVSITAVNGDIVVTLTTATINGRAVPAALVADMQAAVEAAVDSLIAAALAGLSYSASIGYSVDALIVTGTEMNLTITVDLSSLPTPTRRPRRSG